MRLKNLLATLLLGAMLLAPAHAVSFTVQAVGKMTAVSVNSYAGPQLLICVGTYDFDSSYPTNGEAFDLGSWLERGTLAVSMAPSAGYVFSYDLANEKIKAYLTATVTPAGTVAAPTFTGSALAAHAHALHLNEGDVADGATTRVNAGANLLGANTGGDLAIAGVADTSGAGGIVNITAGTPAGTNSAPTFTGSATTAAALAEVANATNLSSVTGVPFMAFGFAP